MQGFSAGEWIAIIAAVFSGLCSVIAAWKSQGAARETKKTSEKMDTVVENTNGNVVALQESLKKEKNRSEHLSKVVAGLVDHTEPGTLEIVNSKLTHANKLERRRSTDGD